MKKIIFSLLSCLWLAGCSSSPPGPQKSFTRTETDSASHSLMYRYDPRTVNWEAMRADALAYCKKHGYDRVAEIDGLDSALSERQRSVFLCNYNATLETADSPEHAKISRKKKQKQPAAN